MYFKEFIPHLHKWQDTLLIQPHQWCDATVTYTDHKLTSRCKLCLGVLSMAYLYDMHNNFDCTMYENIEVPITDHQFLGLVESLGYRDDIFEYFYYEFDPINRIIVVFNEFTPQPYILDVRYAIYNYALDDLKLETIKNILVHERVMHPDDVLLYRDFVLPRQFLLN